jgi:two-component system chemotaxis response regulator CheB
MNESFENVICKHDIEAVVIGTSSGGISALEKILPVLPKDYSIPIIIVQHISTDAGGYLLNHFKRICVLDVCEVADLEPIIAGKIFFAPPGYHLMIEPNKTFSLCVGEKISYSRPSIDVLFSTAANVYKSHLLGIILTGANYDGTAGAKQIKQNGGLIIAQSPETAEAACMPESVITSGHCDAIASLEAMASLLKKIG